MLIREIKQLFSCKSVSPSKSHANIDNRVESEISPDSVMEQFNALFSIVI